MKPRAFLSLTISFVLTLMLGACSFAGDDAAAPHGAAAKTASSQPSQESSENSQESMKNTTATTKHVYSKSGYDITPYSKDKVQALAATLSKEAYDVTQRAGTEAAFCGNLLDNHKDGMYVCVVCGLPLFSSENKFNSGTGWPSFYKEFDPAHVVRHDDNSFGMVRTEIRCARCGAHLGHVFDDGPKPTGERHCLNSAALKFIEKGETVPAESQPVNTETAYFAGGCFWG
ncbi:MAG TPA: peptide-methionine (R)-S-oxide reductase MsrB, partial [Phycisphaerales bacterium]|nr:peptide-methionine (R)-S-oxide reductase MsrB [Phycisphaerales bacterium]